MLFYGGLSQILKNKCNHCGCLLSFLHHAQHVHSNSFWLLKKPTGKLFGSREHSLVGPSGRHIHQQHSTVVELDPFLLVSDELSIISNRLHSMVVAEVPKFASAARHFLKMGLEGKRFRPMVLLLMATALDVPTSVPAHDGLVDPLPEELRTRQQLIAQIAEMIHVGSLLHNCVSDENEADTVSRIGSFKNLMGNKLAVLAGDFLLSRAYVSLASLKNLEVLSLLSMVLEHHVIGESMQISTTHGQHCSMDYYLRKSCYKTTSLISNSCKAIALLSGHTSEVSTLAYEYGENLGLAYQLMDDADQCNSASAFVGKDQLTAPILFAMEEFPQLCEVVDRGLRDPADVNLALNYLAKSSGIQRTRELAVKHARMASAAIDALPVSIHEDVQKARRALAVLAQTHDN